jgi:4-coumarate--CoA ligase
MGFKQGDVLGMVLPNIPEFPLALFGAASIGMSVSLINPIFTAGKVFININFN